jgi:hypothetical protein
MIIGQGVEAAASRPASATGSRKNLRQTKRARSFIDLTSRLGFGPPYYSNRTGVLSQNFRRLKLCYQKFGLVNKRNENCACHISNMIVNLPNLSLITEQGKTA